MQENDNVNPESTQFPIIENFNPTSLTEENVEVESELEVEEKLMEGVEEELQDALDEDDLNKKNYLKVTPTLYIQPVESEEVNDEGEKIELFKILNPETNLVETRELTDEERREIKIKQLKESVIRFRPVKHGAVKTVGTSVVISSIGRERKVKDKEIQTNITTNKFGAAYHKKRQRRNKLAKASRKANR